jgi:hypothetical protein
MEDIEAAVEAASLPVTPVAAPEAPAAGPTATLVERQALALLLGRAIGPVADFLLTPEVVADLLTSDESAAWALARFPVSQEAVVPLLAEARRLREARAAVAGPAVPAEAPAVDPGGAAPDPSAAGLVAAPQGEGARSAELDDNQLLTALLEAVGPIGAQIHGEVASLPPEARLEACITTLEGFGVNPGILDALRRRCQPPAADNRFCS